MKPRILQRPVLPELEQAAISQGYTPLQARILAARLPPEAIEDVASYVAPTLRHLDGPHLLPDIGPAAARIARAILEKETLILCTDHDCDGSASQYVMLIALRDYFGVSEIRIKSFTSHRMKEGYGVSDALTDRMIEQLRGIMGSKLMITADQGSTDFSRFARLKEMGIDTVVTDHHSIPPEGPPASAYACVNPIRQDSEFPDRSIPGAHVAWLVMCAVRRLLIECNYLPSDAPSLTPLLAATSLATIADCTNMATSKNNRAVVRYGLWLMNTKPDPCWPALAEASGLVGPITSGDLGMRLGAMINAAGRLDDSMAAVRCLLASNALDASEMAQQLHVENVKRREIQQGMTKEAMPIAQAQSESNVAGIVVHFPEGHAGIHGVVASRVVEAFGRPVVCLSPKQTSPGVLSGSLRSIPGVDIYRVLRRVDEMSPGTLISCGGHPAAAGMSIRLENLAHFEITFRDAIREQMHPDQMGPVVYTDGSLDGPPSMDELAQITALEPYGRAFDAPAFEGYFTVFQVNPVGNKTHLKLVLQDQQGNNYNAIWFSARPNEESPLPVSAGDRARAVFTLRGNTFKGKTTADMLINHLETDKEAA